MISGLFSICLFFSCFDSIILLFYFSNCLTEQTHLAWMHLTDDCQVAMPGVYAVRSLQHTICHPLLAKSY